MTDPSAENTTDRTPFRKSASTAATLDATLAYQSLVSARSRRLRVTGIVLLVAVLGMSLYGVFALMPSLRRTVPHGTGGMDAASAKEIAVNRANAGEDTAQRKGTADRASAARPAANKTDTPRTGESLRSSGGLTERERRAAFSNILFMYGYWSVCGLLILALIIVSWLDFRELGRNYDAYRARLFAQSVAEAEEK